MPEDPTPSNPPDFSKLEGRSGSKPFSLASLDPRLGETLKDIPPEQLAKLFAVARVSVSQQSLYSGPIPPARELEHYEKILPGSVDRILKMAEAQSTHRIEIEKLTVSSQQQQAARGQVFAFCVAIFGLGTAAVCAAAYGQQVFASILGGGTLASLVGVFIVSNKSRDEELHDKKSKPPERPGPPPELPHPTQIDEPESP